MKMNKFRTILASLTLLFAASASAAPVAIDTMFVDAATASLTIGQLGPYTTSTGIVPPAELTMGTYQSSILYLSSTNFDINIYSSGINGDLAPSGTVDGTVIDVDFSSLRVTLNNFNTGNTFDFAFWPLTTELDYGIYTPLDSSYDIGWSKNLRLNIGQFTGVPSTLDVSLQGSLTTVPVPAAIWLFGMGLVSLFGFSRTTRKA